MIHHLLALVFILFYSILQQGQLGQARSVILWYFLQLIFFNFLWLLLKVEGSK